MTLVSMIVAFLLACLLLWAGMEKARDLRPLAGTLRQLGFPSWSAAPLAALVAAWEIGLAGGLLFRPDAWWIHAGVALLGVSFAAAGALALTRKQVIRCNCLGGGSRGKLGTTQIVALLPWLTATWLIREGGQEAPPLLTGLALFAIAALSIASLRAPAVYFAWTAARGDRLAAKEMYWWKK